MMKKFEYFYLGKPLISTEIVELNRFSKFVKIGNNYSDWQKYIKEYLKKSWPKSFQKEERKLAEVNSWENKINSIINNLE